MRGKLMKVVVIGVSGQLARSLTERSADDAHVELVAVGRPHLDLERGDDLDTVIAGLAPDVVINTAAYTAVDAAEGEPDKAFKINAFAAGQVAAAAERIGAAIIQLSTDYVFDGTTEE